jgi:radical SAM protein with 4Fe4S-binding SPASM domain
MKNKYSDYVCIRPFAEAQIMTNGDVLGCCPAWVNHFKLGNLKQKSLKDIWNDKPAQEFRKSVLDGSFRFCNENSCPMLQSKTNEVGSKNRLDWIPYLDVLDDIQNEKLILEHDPLHYQMAYDRSCNLSCPSCRPELIYAKGNERDEINKFQEEIIKNIKTSKRLTITPSGDAFASITFRNFLINLKQEDAPNLHGITILTNGLLLKKYWNDISPYVKSKIDCISVSIDATTSEVYSKIRRGGDFNILVENLEYIRDIIKVPDFAISTVIQKDNYHQLSDFIKFAKKFNCKRLQYQIFEPDFRIWGEPNYFEEWKDKAVQEKTNRLHQNLLKYIDEIELNHENLLIDFGPLLNLKKGIDISQLETVENEYKKIWNSESKSVWFDDQVHYVLKQNIKKIIKNETETDAVYLDKYKIYVYWNHDRQEWVNINEN